MNATPFKGRPITRRNFVSWLVKGSLAGSALLGLGALGRFLSFQSQSNSPAEYDLGPAKNYPTDSLTLAPKVPASIVHNEVGFTALSLVCPHLGCTVNMTDEGFVCPCHGSRFLSDGSLRNGPASKPLAILKVEMNKEGHLIIKTD